MSGSRDEKGPEEEVGACGVGICVRVVYEVWAELVVILGVRLLEWWVSCVP